MRSGIPEPGCGVVPPARFISGASPSCAPWRMTATVACDPSPRAAASDKPRRPCLPCGHEYPSRQELPGKHLLCPRGGMTGARTCHASGPTHACSTTRWARAAHRGPPSPAVRSNHRGPPGVDIAADRGLVEQPRLGASAPSISSPRFVDDPSGRRSRSACWCPKRLRAGPAGLMAEGRSGISTQVVDVLHRTAPRTRSAPPAPIHPQRRDGPPLPPDYGWSRMATLRLIVGGAPGSAAR